MAARNYTRGSLVVVVVSFPRTFRCCTLTTQTQSDLSISFLLSSVTSRNLCQRFSRLLRCPSALEFFFLLLNVLFVIFFVDVFFVIFSLGCYWFGRCPHHLPVSWVLGGIGSDRTLSR